MRTLWLTTMLLGTGALLFGQLDSGSVTVTATRSIGLQPDQAVLTASVLSGLDANFDQILRSVADAHIVESEFSGVTVVNQPLGLSLRWDFDLAVPIAQLPDTISTLRAQLLNITVRGTQVSAERRAAEPCPREDLMADATSQARRMSLAAGIALGPILSVAEGGVIGAVLVPVAASRQGVFSVTVGPYGGSSFAPPLPPSLPVVCSLTVKFGVGR
jgi:hypothetical protein